MRVGMLAGATIQPPKHLVGFSATLGGRRGEPCMQDHVIASLQRTAYLLQGHAGGSGEPRADLFVEERLTHATLETGAADYARHVLLDELAEALLAAEQGKQAQRVLGRPELLVAGENAPSNAPVRGFIDAVILEEPDQRPEERAVLDVRGPHRWLVVGSLGWVRGLVWCEPPAQRLAVQRAGTESGKLVEEAVEGGAHGGCVRRKSCPPNALAKLRGPYGIEQ